MNIKKISFVPALILVFFLSAAIRLNPFKASPPHLISRIAFGSCSHQGEPQPIWRSVEAAGTDLFIFLGDNIYSDTNDMGVLEENYNRLRSNPDFQRFRKKVPIIATWDDHDYGRNNAGAEYEYKKYSQKLFLDFFREPPNSERRLTPGVYTSYTYGELGFRVQIILLDTRYFRSELPPRMPPSKKSLPRPEKEVTLLGQNQWNWFKKELQKPADLRIVASSIQVLAEGVYEDLWVQYSKEREKLFEILKETEAKGVVFISGDRHFSEMSQVKNVLPYPLLDVTSSGLARHSNKMGGIRRSYNSSGLGTIFSEKDHFGLLSIDWSKKDPFVIVEIRDVQSKTWIQHRFHLSQLKA